MSALILLLLSLAGCGQAPLDQESQAPAAPPADRELWEVRLEIYQPGMRAQVEAPYLRDDEEAQTSRADSSARVAFYDSTGALCSTISAARLSLERGAGRLGLGGGVMASAPESVAVQADTLVWDQETGRLEVPGQVRLSAPAGIEAGSHLQGRIDFGEWAMRQVEGHWQGRAYQVQVRAQRETGWRQGGSFTVHYDTVSLWWEDSRIDSRRATFTTEPGRLYLSEGVTSADSVRRFQAAEMEYHLEEQQVMARGQVRLEEPGLRLQAEEAREDRKAGSWQAWGRPATPVFLERDSSAIQAQQLTYLKEADEIAATGQVLFRDQERALEAGRLRYWHRQRRLEAGGGIALRAPQFEGLATAAELVFDLEAARAQLRGDPRLHQQKGEGLILSAGELDFDLKEKELTGRGAFSVDSGAARLRSQRGLYRTGQEELVLSGQVELRHHTPQHLHYLQADSMVAQLQEGRIAQLRAPGALQGRFAELPDQAGWLQAQSGAVFFAAGQVERIELEGEADVTRRAGEETSRFRGRRIALYFEGGSLQRVWIGGEAELWARLPGKEPGLPPALNHVRGEELELRVSEHSALRVVKSAGTYYQEDRDVPAH